MTQGIVSASELISWKDIVVFVVLPLVPIAIGYGFKTFNKKLFNNHEETLRGIVEVKQDIRENRREIKEGRTEIVNHIKDHARGAFGEN